MISRTAILALLGGALLILVPAVRAQTPAQQSGQPPAASSQTAAQEADTKKIDSAKKAEILRLLDLMGTKKMLNQIVPMLAAQIRANMSKDQTLNEKANRAIDLAMARVQARVDSGAYEDLYVSIYAKYFASEDIQQMIQFYETAAGQKLVQIMPQITRDAMAVSMQWVQEDMAAVKTQVDSASPDPSSPPQKDPEKK